MSVTSYPEVDIVLDDLVAAIRVVLADSLVGAYLYGSATNGGFHPRSSDVDVLVVTAKDVGEPLFGDLREMHLEFERKHPRWRDRIDVQYVSSEALRTFRTRVSRIAAISPGDPFSFKDAGTDWAQNWYDVQQNGLVLMGPAPTTLFPAISQAEFVSAIARYAAEVAERGAVGIRHRGAEAYDVLTICRALYSTRTGEQVSKEAAAHWAQAQMPQWSDLIGAAVRIREDASTSHDSCDPQLALEMRQFVTIAANQSRAHMTDRGLYHWLGR